MRSVNYSPLGGVTAPPTWVWVCLGMGLPQKNCPPPGVKWAEQAEKIALSPFWISDFGSQIRVLTHLKKSLESLGFWDRTRRGLTCNGDTHPSDPPLTFQRGVPSRISGKGGSDLREMRGRRYVEKMTPVF